MGKKSTPKAPPAPDYAAAATAQGNANLDASRVGAELANTNQVTPYGNQTFTKNPGSDQWTSTISLSPDQQHLLDLQNQGDKTLGETAVGQLGRVKDSFSQGLDMSGAPDRVNSVNGPNYSMYNSDPAAMQKVGQGPDYGKMTGDTMQLPDYGAQAQQVGDALYKQATSRLDPQFQQAESAERQRLLNTGVAEDSEMYKNAMDTFNRGRNDAYGSANNSSIAARGAELSRMNNDFYTGNAQQFGQQMQKAGFNNAADSQKYADAINSAGFNNAASQQDNANQLQKLGFNNAVQGQQFSDAVTGGNFQNAQRGAAIDEAAYMRNDPLNMYNALSTGAQVTNPQFRGTGQTAAPNAAPTFAATQAADQRAVDLYNAQLASSGSAQGGLFGMLGNLGGSAIQRWGK